MTKKLSKMTRRPEITVEITARGFKSLELVEEREGASTVLTGVHGIWCRPSRNELAYTRWLEKKGYLGWSAEEGWIRKSES